MKAIRIAVSEPCSSPTSIWVRAAAQADLLLDFLKYHDAETIYLVGDIVDGWALRSSWYWPQIA